MPMPGMRVVPEAGGRAQCAVDGRTFGCQQLCFQQLLYIYITGSAGRCYASVMCAHVCDVLVITS